MISPAKNSNAHSSRRKAAAGRWSFLSEISANAPDEIKKLAGALHVSDVSARILLRRGIDNAERADNFLRRRMDLLHDPLLLPDIVPAVNRIAEAVDKGQRIVIFGDYDADGVTSTALLTRFFNLLKTRKKFELDAIVPERKHGYGLSASAVETVLHKRPHLLITVDNGISAHDPLRQLSAAGIDCIVVDHHHVGETLPEAIAVINPKRADSRYPFNELCGAGIAFKLAWALAMHFSHDRKVTPEFRAFLLEAMALAAVGTLADVVPLVDENRILVFHGLKALATTQMPGLSTLRESCNIKNTPRSEDVTFRIAPRLNAAGRCGRAADALELLLTPDAARAAELVKVLENHNTDRQQIESKILQEARQRALATLIESPGCRAFVFDSADWHHGVIGIVASRLVDEFQRPVLLLSIDAETRIAQGSGRSIRKLHLAEALTEHREHLLTFGGHAAAAGLKIEAGKIHDFRLSFQRSVSELLTDDDLVRCLEIDERVELQHVDQRLCHEIDKFEPCGAGNPRPLLAALNVNVPAPPKLMGKQEKHVSFYARHEKHARRVVAFNCGERYNDICDAARGGPMDIAFRPQINEYQGTASVELILEEFRAGL